MKEIEIISVLEELVCHISLLSQANLLISLLEIFLFQPDLNFMFFSSKVLPCPLLCCLTFHRQILPSLGWPGGTVCSWYTKNYKQDFRSKLGRASVRLFRKPVLNTCDLVQADGGGTS